MKWKASLISVVMFAVAYLIMQLVDKGDGFSTNLQGATEALDHIQKTTTWMAGIQTALLAALVTLVAAKPEKIHPVSGPSAIVMLLASLFSAAWVVTAIPSITLRVHGNGSACLSSEKDFDVLSYEIYHNIFSFEFLQPLGCALELNYFVTLQHWFWVASLILFLHIIINILKEGRHNRVAGGL